jgi:hypothetical protein
LNRRMIRNYKMRGDAPLVVSDHPALSKIGGSLEEA